MSGSNIAGTEIENLIKLLSKLPGLGPRSARRAALHLIKKKEQVLVPLARAMDLAVESITTCSECGNIGTIDPCTICTDSTRNSGVIVVVEDVSDLWALERAAAVKASYHVLGGTLSSLDGIGPEDLNIGNLISRVSTGRYQEIILAVNATIEGQSTAHYITEQLKNFNVEISRLAHGVPVGGELDFLDDGTLSQAIKARTKF